jgi:hypothetical protein
MTAFFSALIRATFISSRLERGLIAQQNLISTLKWPQHTISEDPNQVYALDYRHDGLKFATAGQDYKAICVKVHGRDREGVSGGISGLLESFTCQMRR